MNKSQSKLVSDCLKFSVSKDETRLHLNGVYFDPKSEMAVSTDGFIMTYSRSSYVQEFADMIVDFKSMNTIRREFLKYDAVIPKSFKHVETVKIDKSLGVKSQRRVTIKAFFIKDQGFILAKNYSGEYEFAINPEFLKPLLGHTLEVSYNEKLSVVHFTLVENDSYYLIMPIKV